MRRKRRKRLLVEEVDFDPDTAPALAKVSAIVYRP
jgi:hypothetical protein